MFKKIKYFIQRGRRGYSDEDVWSFDHYLCEIIPPALRQIKEKGAGCPSEYYDEKNKNNECKPWHEILEEIAQGFESAKILINHDITIWKENKDGNYTMETDHPKAEQASKKMKRGLALFSEHFLNLWD